MRPVEPVPGEQRDELEEFERGLGRDASRGSAAEELLALLGHLDLVLLAHRGAKDVGFTEREAGDG